MGEPPHEKRMSETKPPQSMGNGVVGGITMGSGAATGSAGRHPAASGDAQALDSGGTGRKSGSGKTVSGHPADYDDTVPEYCSQLMQVVAGKPHYYSLFKACVRQQKQITIKVGFIWKELE
eukprot:g12559.t1